MEDHQDVEEWIEVVCGPEGVEDIAPRVLNSEHIHQKDQTQEQNACDAGYGLPTPVVEFRQNVGSEDKQQMRLQSHYRPKATDWE